MNLSLRPPGGHATWNAVLIFGLAVLMLWVGLAGSSKVMTVFGVALVVSAFGFWGNCSWAKWTTAIAIFLYAGLAALGMARQGFRWTTSLILLSIVGFAVQILLEKDEKENLPGGDRDGIPPKPLTSFVLLLDAARRLTAADLSAVLGRAWGGVYGSRGEIEGDGEGPESANWVVGKSPIFLIKSDDAMFMLHNFPSPYSGDSRDAAQSIPDLRLRKAIEDHRAWLAVDLLQPFDPGRPAESFYPRIARLIAELAGDDCLAVFHPESTRINAWDESLKTALRGPEPLKEFAKPVNPPVLRIDEKDPDLLAGKAEARRRLPEFIDAFRRKDGEHFSIKAPLTAGGRTEHLWIKVEELEGERVGGTLGNEPVSLGGLKLGDRVDVELSEVEDWVVVRGGSPTGLFSTRAVGRGLQKP
jgi:uncharacterized protein YegJ (DUF2314 family)